MIKQTKKPVKGVIPAGFADGGKVKPFAGKDTKAEEKAEGQAVRSGKVTPKQYAAREKAEGEKASAKTLMTRGKALATGKLTPNDYSKGAKMANGGMVKGSMKKGC